MPSAVEWGARSRESGLTSSGQSATLVAFRTTAFVVMALVFTLLLAPETSATPAATPPAEVVFVNVGNGDGVVLRIGGKIIVSDAGERFASQRMAAVLTSLGAKQIDVAILSHPHEDHVGGFIDLFREFPPRLVLASTNRHWSSTSSNRLLLNEISRSGAPIRWVQAGDRFAFGGASWQILNPPAGEFTAPRDAGNSSVVYLLTVHGRRLLFAGDIAEGVASSLASSWTYGRVDVFLVPNQGSKHSATAEFLEATRPRFAVLSVGPNPFGHPAAETPLPPASSGRAGLPHRRGGDAPSDDRAERKVRLEDGGEACWRGCGAGADSAA